ncbi:hypothetical protein LSCM1_00007 [Leishmania martiniquensis]|uniref:SAP domain-containing protein n=1 Tax=Leishmania martiniquensis TaxID=1580590 RepID=A0A836K8E5_9TRYP|nr:hypothetical protein LSCM1_00007 [Leishmania martiniquensis]
MDPVKRRLVYVADESEILLSDLSGTPPTRQSRLTRLLVPLSPPTSSQQSPHSFSPLPRPVDTTAEAASAVVADTALLVSYDGFLLTDGNGRFSTPRDAAQAASIRDALRSCCAFLKVFLDGARTESASPESCCSGTSSSTYMEEEDSDLEDSISDDSPAPRRRVSKAARGRQLHGPPRSPSHMTVAELKELLRHHGLSITGNKASLLKRAQKLQRDNEPEQASHILPVGADESEMALRSTLPDHTTRSSGVSVSFPPLSHPSSKKQSPDSQTGDDQKSGIWGALVQAGTRLLRGGARASWGFHTQSPEVNDDATPLKRRRLDA